MILSAPPPPPPPPPPPLPIRPPLFVHHMGACDGAPAGPAHPAQPAQCVPNSLEAMRACLEAKAAFVETDITALADTDYLLVHDPRLESETTGRGPVGECSAAEAARLCFRYRKVETAIHVPRLSEVVALFLDYPGPTRLQLDFKNVIPFRTDEPIERLVRLVEPLGSRVIISTSADWQLRKMRALAPWLDLGLDIHFYMDWRDPHKSVNAEAYPRLLGAYGYWDDHPIAKERWWPTAEYLADRCAFLIGLVPRVSTFYVSHRFLAQSLDDGFNWAEALHKQGIKLDAWTLDAGNQIAETNAKRLLVDGVDQFTTNTPIALARLLSGPQGAQEEGG